ncbi:R-spondin-3 [Procambarus clarkii]|uniref:R-spondin-3 n=1 Tax=Procambarus clarkii TaxID=6728 RepID=UPI003743EDC4
MVAAHLVLMNHFFVSLTHNTPDLAIHDVNSVLVDLACPLGCTQCSAVNGCLACKPPFFLLLHREGTRQTASCTRACPRGFYKLKKKRNGFCAKCTMRGCSECLGDHYCSSCNPHYVNFFGKCITQPPENEIAELGGIFVTRPPLGFPATPAPVTAASLDNTSTSPSTALPILILQASTTRPSNSTAPTRESSMMTPAGRGAETKHNTTMLPSGNPPSSAGSWPEGPSHATSTPSSDHDSRPCRRKHRRRKEGRRHRKERKNRKGDNGGRRRNGKKANRKKEERIVGREGNAQGHINHKSRRRGCRRRENSDDQVSHKGTTRQNSSERDGTISRNFSPAGESQPAGGHSTRNIDKPSDKYEFHRDGERVRLSLLTETKKLDSRPTHIVDTKKFLYKNRPQAMVEFKLKKTLRLSKPSHANGHRVRHGRPRRERLIKT